MLITIQYQSITENLLANYVYIIINVYFSNLEHYV